MGVVALGDIGLGCGLGRGHLGNISIIQQGVVIMLGVACGILQLSDETIGRMNPFPLLKFNLFAGKFVK